MRQPSRPHRGTLRRRTFVRSIAYAGALAPFVGTRLVRAVSPNAKVMHICFGGSGMGAADMKQLTAHPRCTLYAVCDVDERNFATAKEINPSCKAYVDWRELLDKEEGSFDSANVTIPDHMHAPVAMSLIQRGKHVYCQKPLTHDVFEARRLTEAAAKGGVVTQMGIQIHSAVVYRLAVQLVHDGRIGKVREAHAWSNKNWGATEGPGSSSPIPPELHWDLWLGTSRPRPYVEGAYHPSNWRRWLDLGTGTFGDMGCHIMDPVIGALGVGAPITVMSSGPAPVAGAWPTEAQVRYTFDGTSHTTDTVGVTWYDGGRMPPAHVLEALEDVNPPDQGSILIGEKGALLIPHVAAPRLFPRSDFAGERYPTLEPLDHWGTFIEAAGGEGRTTSPFDYSGPLTETVLLGGLAVRFPGETLRWDAPKMTFGRADADAWVRREYRKGWGVEGL